MAIGKKYFWSLKIPTKAPATKRNVELWDPLWCIAMQNLTSYLQGKFCDTEVCAVSLSAFHLWLHPVSKGCFGQHNQPAICAAREVCRRCQWSNAARQTWRQGTQRRTASPVLEITAPLLGGTNDHHRIHPNRQMLAGHEGHFQVHWFHALRVQPTQFPFRMGFLQPSTV